MQKDAPILIVGHGDIVDQSLYEALVAAGYRHVTSSDVIGLDTTIQPAVYDFFQQERPQYVFLTSVRSGGIEANLQSPADFIHQNLESQNNVIYAAWKFQTRKLLFVASSCVYPRECSQPMKEEMLGTGPLESSSEPYALAKLAGIAMCRSFRRQHGLKAIAAIPATVYGPGSDMDLEKAHVIGALVKRISDAAATGQNEVVLWGSGEPRREFLYRDDFVSACLHLMQHYDGEEPINVGCGEDVSIRDLAEMIAAETGFKGGIRRDASRPDGVARKLLDASRLRQMGWSPAVTLRDGIQRLWTWHQGQGRPVVPEQIDKGAGR